MRRGGLAAARALARRGVAVVGVDWARGACGSVSRYARFLRCPPPREGGRLLEFLLAKGRKHSRPPVLILADDHFADLVARHQDELRSRFLFPRMSPPATDVLVNKRGQYELARQLGIAHPKTWFPENPDEIIQHRNEVDYPAIVKPYESHLFQQSLPVKGFVADTPEQLVGAVKRARQASARLMVQSFIPGPPTKLYTAAFYIRQDGAVGGSYVCRKIRQCPVELGHGSMVETVSEPAVEELAAAYCRGAGFRGIGGMEFKWDERDRQWKFLELNPRCWSHFALAADSGVDLAWLQYLDLTGAPLPPPTRARPGVLWADSMLELRLLPGCLRRRELTLTAWLKAWSRVSSYATFSWADPLPYLVYVVAAVWRVLRRLRGQS
jgi:predicted ATP-grasp superfamily ATP-dependent carboligase